MGLLSALFGGSTTQKTTYDVPSSLQSTLNQSQQQARTAFNQPFQPYTDPRIAQFSGDELAGFDAVRRYSNPFESTAYKLEQQGLNRFLGAPTQNDLQPFMNPFTEGVLDRTNKRLTDQLDRRLNKIRNTSATQGAYGGSRFAVMENEAIEDFMDTIADTNYRGLYDAFNQGIDRFYNTGITGFNLSQQAQNRELDRAQALLNIGGAQRQLSQLGLDFDFAEFMRGINEPKQDAISLAQVGAMYPTNIINSKTKTTQQPGLLNSIAGLAGSVLGIPGVSSALGLGGGGVSLPVAGSTPSTSGFNFGFNPYTGGSYTAGNFTVPIPGLGGGKHGGLVRKKYADGGVVNPELKQTMVELGRDVSEWFGKSNEERFKNSLFRTIGTKKPQEKPKLVRENILDVIKSEPETSANKPKSNQITSKPAGNKRQPAFSEILLGAKSNNSPFSLMPQEPKINPRLPENSPDPADTRDFMDRWLDNPWTQFGLSMLAGMNNDTGRSAALMLGTRKEEVAEQTRQRELQQQRAEQQRQFEMGHQLNRDQLNAQIQKWQREAELDAQRIAVMRAQVKNDKEDKFMAQVEDRLTNLTNKQADLWGAASDPSILSDENAVNQLYKEINEIEQEKNFYRQYFDKQLGLPSVERPILKDGKYVLSGN